MELPVHWNHRHMCIRHIPVLDRILRTEITSHCTCNKIGFLLDKCISYFLGDYQSTKVINDAIAEFNSKSCVKFMPYQGIERDYVIFIKNDG